MEFHSKLLQPMQESNVRGWNGPLPFYMTYPGCRVLNQEAMLLQDLEYLQQTWPDQVRRCQKRIAQILDKADYEGSMIYDEYPLQPAGIGEVHAEGAGDGRGERSRGGYDTGSPVRRDL